MNTPEFTQESTQVQRMFSSIAERYDITNTVLSGGIHHIWKRHFISSIPMPPGIQVLDLACGTGDLVPLLGKKFGSNITGGDFCEPMLEVARKRFGSLYRFQQCDALNMPFTNESMDLVTVSFGVRNFEDLSKGLSEIHRVLKPGGMVAVLEFGQPDGALFGPFYRWYSKFLMPAIGGVLTGNREAYAYLPETAARFPSGEKFLQKLADSGFKDCTVRRYTFGIAFGYMARK